ncbi:MAG: hypothetical protein ACM31C_15005 [Acidobacteriota bacterium]
MRLELAFGPDWSREELGAVQVYTAPGFALVPDAFFEVFPLVARNRVNLDAILLHDVPAGTLMQRAPVEPYQTVTGWPLSLHHVTLHDGGQLREIRVLAHYQLLVLAGFVLVRITNERRYVEHRAQMIELLQSARAHLADDTPAAIAELWEMLPP